MGNAAQFGWDLAALQEEKLFFLNAQPTPDLFHSGTFDLQGMLAALEGKAREIGARRIVFDALDVVLALLNDPVAERREVYRLHEWLLAHGLTALITSKTGDRDLTDPEPAPARVHAVHGGLRGGPQSSGHPGRVAAQLARGEISRLVLRGKRVSFPDRRPRDGGSGRAGDGSAEDKPVSNERVSSGVPRLDAMLGGGYYRGASMLITGFPGTAKSTLSGAFTEAACGRGERTLFISFDSDANEVVRNLASVNIRLAGCMKKGMLRLVSARAITGSAETHLMQIKNLAQEHQARCLVIDPVSALSKSGNERDGAQRGRATDRLDQNGGHDAGLHQPAR